MNKIIKKIFYTGLGILIIHAIIVLGLLATMIIMWKVFQPSTYYLWERVAIIVSIPVCGFSLWWEEFEK